VYIGGESGRPVVSHASLRRDEKFVRRNTQRAQDRAIFLRLWAPVFLASWRRMQNARRIESRALADQSPGHPSASLAAVDNALTPVLAPAADRGRTYASYGPSPRMASIGPGTIRLRIACMADDPCTSRAVRMFPKGVIACTGRPVPRCGMRQLPARATKA